MLDQTNAKSKETQEQFMSANKSGIRKKEMTSSRSARPSALMKIARTIDTSVDSSLDAFIADANSTLDSIGGWGISPEQTESFDGVKAAEKRAESAENRIAKIEEQTQSKLVSAQRQLAEAEAKVAAAELRAQNAENATKKAKANVLAASTIAKRQPALEAKLEPPAMAIKQEAALPVAPTAAAVKPKSKIGLFLGIGGAAVIGFAAATIIGGGKTEKTTTPANTVVAPQAKENIPTKAATAKEEAPIILPLEVAAPVEPEPVVIETNSAEIEAAKAAQKAEALAAEVKAAEEMNTAQAAKTAKDAKVTKAAKTIKKKTKSSPKNKTKKKLLKKKKQKSKAKPKGGIVDPFA